MELIKRVFEPKKMEVLNYIWFSFSCSMNKSDLCELKELCILIQLINNIVFTHLIYVKSFRFNKGFTGP